MSERKLRKTKNYSEETLQLALKEIEKGFSYRSISLKYKIPRSTLQNRSTGKTQYQERPGPKNLKINEESEKLLVDWILQSNQAGVEVKKSMIAKYAKENLKCDGKFSHGWYRSFFRRNPEIQSLVKQVEVQKHYGMDIKSEDAFIINRKEDNDFSDMEEAECDSIEEYFSTSPLATNLEVDAKTKTMPEIKFEKNVSVKSALCFACSALITEIELTTGIRCFSCFRTYHITCAYKQEMEKQLNAEITEPFSCLVCWKKLNN